MYLTLSSSAAPKPFRALGHVTLVAALHLEHWVGSAAVAEAASALPAQRSASPGRCRPCWPTAPATPPVPAAAEAPFLRRRSHREGRRLWASL